MTEVNEQLNEKLQLVSAQLRAADMYIFAQERVHLRERREHMAVIAELRRQLDEMRAQRSNIEPLSAEKE